MLLLLNFVKCSFKLNKIKSTLPKLEDDDLWGSIVVPVPKNTLSVANFKTSTLPSEDDELCGSIATPPPKYSRKPLKPAVKNNDDLWVPSPHPTINESSASSIIRPILIHP